MVEHLTEKTSVEENLDQYFPSLNTEKYDWVRNRFVDVPSNIGFKLYEEELATISSDRSLQIKHSQISIQKEFPTVAEKALLVILQFSTSYMCELGFPTLNNIKNKKRESLRSTKEEMRVSIQEVRRQQQAQVSH